MPAEAEGGSSALLAVLASVTSRCLDGGPLCRWLSERELSDDVVPTSLLSLSFESFELTGKVTLMTLLSSLFGRNTPSDSFVRSLVILLQSETR